MADFTDIRSLIKVVDFATNFSGSSRGEGARLLPGHVISKPEGDSVDGCTRKLKEPTALCKPQKYSVISFEENK